jgi:hypothetical protein
MFDKYNDSAGTNGTVGFEEDIPEIILIFPFLLREIASYLPTYLVADVLNNDPFCGNILKDAPMSENKPSSPTLGLKSIQFLRLYVLLVFVLLKIREGHS